MDIFAPPGAQVYVPKHATLEIVRTTYDPYYYKAQAFGWIEMCGETYGFVAAHLAEAPIQRTYESGERYGAVAGLVKFTPHVHIALSAHHIPPPGDLNPVTIWRGCMRQAKPRRRKLER